MADAYGDGEFEDVLCYFGWWDCPRSGISLVGARPHYFDCRFSDDLDDYPDQYRVWPVPDDELADELEVWQCFVQWRGQFDGGAQPGPFPGQLRTEAFSRVQERHIQQPPESARVAIPAWRLDRNRSFAGRVPMHRARWTFC